MVCFSLFCQRFSRMDSATISFQNLNLKHNLFQEQLEDLHKESKAKILGNPESLNKKELYFNNVKELSEEAEYQRLEEISLLKEQNECIEHLAVLNKRIKTIEETIQKLKNEESLGKSEMKQIKKPLLKAIKKYSTSFNMDVEVREHGNENTFMASVNLSTKAGIKTVDLFIDRRDRRILDFDAGSLLSEDETKELKNKILTENEVNIELLLSKLRDIS